MADDPVRVANALAWSRKAQEDLARVERCLSADPPDREDALFHCQQAAEKALKAFLTWHDEPFKKTHDLSALGKQCTELDAALSALMERLDDLTEYSWVFRYPGSFVEPPAPEVDEARELAGKVVAEIVRRLPQGKP